MSPRYDQYRDAWDTSVLAEVNSSRPNCIFFSFPKLLLIQDSIDIMMFSLKIKVGDKLETVRFFHCYKRGVDRVFVDHPMFLEKVGVQSFAKCHIQAYL